MTMKTSHKKYERIALTFAVLLLFASLGWWWRQRPVITALKQETLAFRVNGGDYAAAEPTPEQALPEWVDPPAQSRGDEWHYEVFTPPAVYYHAASGAFAVGLPTPTETESPVELVEAKPEPYRVQLIGCLGAPGDYVGVFSSSEQSETLLARTGGRIASLDVSVKAIELARIPFADAEGRRAEDWTVRAILHDERTGEEVVLTPGGAANLAGRAPRRAPPLVTERAERVVATEPAR